MFINVFTENKKNKNDFLSVGVWHSHSYFSEIDRKFSLLRWLELSCEDESTYPLTAIYYWKTDRKIAHLNNNEYVIEKKKFFSQF